MKHIKVDLNKQANKSFPVAVIVSLFNKPITEELVKGNIAYLKQSGIEESDITLIEVPGAVEIPLVAQKLAEQKKHQVIIALGAVIRGETSHYDYVCSQVSEGCQEVSLKFNLPVIFGVLTTENEAQAWDRLGGRHGHNGVNAAKTAIAMQQLLTEI